MYENVHDYCSAITANAMTFSFTFDAGTGHVSIGEGSTEIPVNTFYEQNDVQSVYIPDSVITIGAYAFRENSLTELAIPESVSTIGNSAFNFNKLSQVVIPDSVVSIGDSAFSNNVLTEIVLGDSVLSIGDGAFRGNSLDELVLGSSVTHIGGKSFKDNNLAEIVIGGSVVSIGYGAFMGNGLTDVVIEDSVTSIGYGAFFANDLDEVRLPSHFESNPPYDAFDEGVIFSFRDDFEPTQDPTPEPEPDCGNSTEVFRFYNADTSVHFFTPSSAEKDDIISKPEWGYQYEGVAYKAPIDTGSELYRFYNRSKGYHFLTASAVEADFLTGKPEWGYRYEGRSYKVSHQETSETPNDVHRFYNPGKGIHFYSASEAEANNIIANSLGSGFDLNNALKEDDLLPNGWGYIYEGIAWYVTDC